MHGWEMQQYLGVTGACENHSPIGNKNQYTLEPSMSIESVALISEVSMQ